MPFLRDAFVYLAATVVVVPLATRLGAGSVLGYLVAGVLVGPHGLGLAGDPEGVLRVAEFGVVLLLFLVGLDLDPRRLVELRRDVFGLGALQVLGTAGAVLAIALAAGVPWPIGLVAGLGLSLSSTALVVQLLAERRELATRHGQVAFAILLFQDLAVIPMLAILPALGSGPAAPEAPLWLTFGRAAVVVAVVVLAARFVARPVFRFVAAQRNAEIFTATALLLVVATALGVSLAGLSMALGAFLAGVLLATSEYRHELEADVAPFKGLLLGLFFLAVGMTADLRVVVERPLAVAGIVVGLVAVKGLVGFVIGRRFVGGGAPAVSLAIALSQGGEFAFVLFRLASGQGILEQETAGLLVVAVTLSMATTPALFGLHRWIVRRRAAGQARPYDVLPDHDPQVVIAGFGRVGQVVARVLGARRILFTAIDASAEHIDFVRRFGNKVFYGDVARLDLLRAAHVERARLFVLAIDDVDASVRTAELVREHFPGVKILARARNRQHAYRLRRLGIEVIVRETLLSSLQLTASVLADLGVPPAAARRAVERFHAHDEALFEASWQHQDDLEKLTDLTRRGREELERLFDEDAKDQRTG